MDFQKLALSIQTPNFPEKGFICLKECISGTVPSGVIILKPEISALTYEHFNHVLDYFKQLCCRHDIRVLSSHILSGGFLKQEDVIAQIYEKISFYAMISMYAEDNKDPKVSAVLEQYPECKRIIGGSSLVSAGEKAEEIYTLWSSQPAIKVRDEMYALPCVYRNESILLINGFFPGQKKKFEARKSKTIFFTFETTELFPTLKSRFQGSSDPKKQHPDSFRHFLYKKNPLFKPEVFSTSQNGIHVSENLTEGQREATTFLQLMRKNHNPLREDRCQHMS